MCRMAVFRTMALGSSDCIGAPGLNLAARSAVLHGGRLFLASG
jgi:hypothetical protein